MKAKTAKPAAKKAAPAAKANIFRKSKSEISKYLYRMFKKFFSPNPFKTFYFVFAYIIAFSLWWAYLLYAKNETAFKEKIELNKITFEKTNQAEDYTSSKKYTEVVSKYHRQKHHAFFVGACE